MRTKITCFLLLIPSPLRKAMCLLFFFLTTLMKLPGALYSIKPNARSESTREFLMGSRALPCLLSSRPTVHADSALLLKSNRLPGLTRPEAPLSPSFPRSQSHVSPGTCSIRAAAQATHAGRHTHSSLSVPRSLGTSPRQSRCSHPHRSVATVLRSSGLSSQPPHTNKPFLRGDQTSSFLCASVRRPPSPGAPRGEAPAGQALPRPGHKADIHRDQSGAKCGPGHNVMEMTRGPPRSSSQTPAGQTRWEENIRQTPRWACQDPDALTALSSSKAGQEEEPSGWRSPGERDVTGNIPHRVLGPKKALVRDADPPIHCRSPKP